MTTPDSIKPAVDYSLFRAVNGLAGHNRILDAAMVGFAQYSPYVLAAVLIGLWLTWTYRNQRGAFLAGLSTLLALGIGKILATAFPHERPFLAHPVVQLIAHAPDNSFPSDHTTLAFAVATIIWFFNRRVGVVLVLFGLVTAFARVFVGVHYPSDVLGGAVVGAATAFVVWKVSGKLSIERWIEKLFDALAEIHVATRRHPVE